VLATREAETVVDRPLDKGMAEAISPSLLVKHRRSRQLFERVDESRAAQLRDRGERLASAVVTQDSRGLQQAVCFAGQTDDAFCDDLTDAFRNAPGRRVTRLPGEIATFLFEIADDLLDKERVPGR